jgi:hypothetical protein
MSREMKKIALTVLNFKPRSFGLLFILMPIISLIGSVITAFISIFANFEVVFSLFAISITIIVSIHLIWIWGVIFYVEEKVSTNKIFFKISYWLYFSYCLLVFISNLEINALEKNFLIENKTIEIIQKFSDFYALLVFVCYGYISYFVAKKIQTLSSSQTNSFFIYFSSAWVFILGIPFFLQPILLKQPSLFDKLTNYHS